MDVSRDAGGEAGLNAAIGALPGDQIQHAEQARRHGDGHRAAVAVNQALSFGIVGAYEAMRRVRAARASPHQVS